MILLLSMALLGEAPSIMLLKAEVSKRFYSSKAKSSNVHYFAPPIGTVLRILKFHYYLA